jgi:error-prone DNA polymerase
VGKMMHPYMRRRQGKEEVTYPHPSLEPVLKRTLGVPLFQEQLLRMAMTVASFSGAEAEELRRAVGMRRSMQRMKDLEGKLRDGMTRNGIGRRRRTTLCRASARLRMYGFPESHAASFALIAYASAYLKVHYLAAFTCGLLNNQPMGFYSPAVLIKDAQRHGLRVRPIDVQRSEWLCTLERSGRIAVSAHRLQLCEGTAAIFGGSHLGSTRQSGMFASCRRSGGARAGAEPQGACCAGAQSARSTRLGTVEHRRDALWQVEQAGRPVGPLLRNASSGSAGGQSPLRKMTTTSGWLPTTQAPGLPPGHIPWRGSARSCGGRAFFPRWSWRRAVPSAGCVWPGASSAGSGRGRRRGLCFSQLEDETGIANIIFEQNRARAGFF